MEHLSFPPAPPYVLKYGSIDSNRNDISYFIIGFFTKNYEQKAKILSISLTKHNLPYALFLVTDVHHSTSVKGIDDLRYSKPNFIYHFQKQINTNIVYLDCDIVICEQPSLFNNLANDNIDFSVFNWFNITNNTAFVPISESETNLNSKRYYVSSHSINLESKTELLCSGAVQYWGNTNISHALLKSWLLAIEKYSQVADDQCLDYAYNYGIGLLKSNIKTYWLNKSYCRIAWWIFDKPVINHPDFPAASLGFKTIENDYRSSRFDSSNISVKSNLINKYANKIIDATGKNIYYVENKIIKNYTKLEDTIY